MKNLISVTAGLVICFLSTQCSNDEANPQPDSKHVTDSNVAAQTVSAQVAVSGTPRLNKPCIDPGNVFNQTFHRGDTLFLNGVNLGTELALSTLDLVGGSSTVANLPFEIAAPFTRGSFIIPEVPNGTYYLTLRIGGVLVYTHSETFRVN